MSNDERSNWIEQQESSSDNRVVAIPASELRQLLRDAMAFADAHREGQEEVAVLMEEVAKKVAMIRALEADVSRLMAILG